MTRTATHYIVVRAAGPPGKRIILYDYIPSRTRADSPGQPHRRAPAASLAADATNSLIRDKEKYMPKGKPGDNPITDILLHNRNIYSPYARDLIREIATLADEKTRQQLG